MNDCCEAINEAYEQLKGELEELRLRLRQRRGAWQPIDSAPSWRRVLAISEGGWVSIAEKRESYWWDGDGTIWPVGWMELPT